MPQIEGADLFDNVSLVGAIDASSTHLGGGILDRRNLDFTVSGDLDAHINIRELSAILHLVKLTASYDLLNLWPADNRRLIIFCDNASAVSWINKLSCPSTLANYSSILYHLNELLVEVRIRRLFLAAFWLPGCLNEFGDLNSRPGFTPADIADFRGNVVFKLVPPERMVKERCFVHVTLEGYVQSIGFRRNDAVLSANPGCSEPFLMYWQHHQQLKCNGPFFVYDYYPELASTCNCDQVLTALRPLSLYKKDAAGNVVWQRGAKAQPDLYQFGDL